MENAIRQFVQTRIKQGVYFDSHAVIQHIIQNHSSLYLQSSGVNDNVETYHGRIAQILSTLEKQGLVTNSGTSFSKNVKDNFTECTLWQKQ